MSEHIKLIKPYISFDEVADDLKDIFDSGQLTKGRHVDKFVAGLKDYTAAEHAFLTTSATTALTMSLKAINVKVGDKVAVSDFSWPATCNVVEDLGATPVFIDVDRLTYNMCPIDLEKKLDTSFAGVIVVDALGNPSGIRQLKEICHSHKIPLIQDSACAIGSSVDGIKVGAIADLTCYSFHPRKLLTTGEGGAVLTNNSQYAEWLTIKLAAGASGIKGRGLDFVDYGYNYRLSEVQALMGWMQLLKLDDITEERNAIADEYAAVLEPLGFSRQKVDVNVHHNVQSLIFTVPEGMSRDALIDHLASKNIESTLGTYCLSATTYYLEKYNDLQPNSLWLESNTITLPCYTGVDVELVTDTIRQFV
ncbi:MAG: aminotransferase class I/II-fold pyridoxal phosphate-dependent enzyme [Porticoccaceae bacterium]|nr:aminotransferase class I/II-fold pyridoxal phosphate-dependent enzyme [Porticoccaceae bacterium]